MDRATAEGPMPSFSKVISLGPSCETAYQIRQIVVQEEAYVFDWVIAPASSVARAIRNGFAEFVQPDGLSLQGQAAGHPFVADSLTGIEFHHDFRNDDAFLDTLPDVRGKYRYLLDRMRATLAGGTPVLFVHQMGTADHARLLAEAVAQSFPALEFRLLELSIGTPTIAEVHDTIVFRSIPGHGSNWQERTPQWAVVLDELLGRSYGHSLTRRDPATRETV